MIRFLADENVKWDIVKGVQRRLPELDILRVQDAGLRTFRDEVILEFAANEGRVLLTHDVTTIGPHALARLKAGKRMPGVLLLNQFVPIGRAIDHIIAVAERSRPDELDNLVQFLPLRIPR